MNWDRQTQLWPAHPHPLNDELLSSWVVRLAHANGLKLRPFLTLWMPPGIQYWAIDIDASPPSILIEILAEKTGLSIESIRSLSLSSLDGFLFEAQARFRHIDWILGLCLPRPGRAGSGQQYCPECLAEDPDPYLRRTWRLAWATVCTKHRTFLQDQCGSCGAQVLSLRVDMGSAARHIPHEKADYRWCARCKADLSSSAKQGDHPPPSLLHLQSLCEQAVSQGFLAFAGNPSMHSLAFFAGLRNIVAGFHRARNDLSEGRISTKRQIEWMPIGERAELMNKVATVVANWPDEFYEAVKTFPSPRNLFRDAMRQRPFWFDTVFRTLGRVAKSISAEELGALQSVVERQEGRFTPGAAHRIFGKNLAWKVRVEHPCVEDEDAEWLLASIDQTISISPDRDRKFLFRDKMMFMAARVTSANQMQLVSETLDSNWLLPTSECTGAKGCASVPATIAEMQPALRWYVDVVRPQFDGAASLPWLFLGRSQKHRLSRSMVGNRFGLAVQRAHLELRIPDFSAWIRRSSKTTTSPDRMNPEWGMH